MAVSLNKMKSTCRISDGKTMIVPAVTVNGGALQADWRDCKLIGIAAVPGSIDLTVGNPISEAVDYAALATCSLSAVQSLFGSTNLKMREWTGNPRAATAFTNFFRDLKKPRKQRKFRYPKFKKKRWLRVSRFGLTSQSLIAGIAGSPAGTVK